MADSPLVLYSGQDNVLFVDWPGAGRYEVDPRPERIPTDHPAPTNVLVDPYDGKYLRLWDEIVPPFPPVNVVTADAFFNVLATAQTFVKALAEPEFSFTVAVAALHAVRVPGASEVEVATGLAGYSVRHAVAQSMSTLTAGAVAVRAAPVVHEMTVVLTADVLVRAAVQADFVVNVAAEGDVTAEGGAHIRTATFQADVQPSATVLAKAPVNADTSFEITATGTALPRFTHAALADVTVEVTADVLVIAPVAADFVVTSETTGDVDTWGGTFELNADFQISTTTTAALLERQFRNADFQLGVESLASLAAKLAGTASVEVVPTATAVPALTAPFTVDVTSTGDVVNLDNYDGGTAETAGPGILDGGTATSPGTGGIDGGAAAE